MEYLKQYRPGHLQALQSLIDRGLNIYLGFDSKNVFYGVNGYVYGDKTILIALNKNYNPASTLIHELFSVLGESHSRATVEEKEFQETMFADERAEGKVINSELEYLIKKIEAKKVELYHRFSGIQKGTFWDYDDAYALKSLGNMGNRAAVPALLKVLREEWTGVPQIKIGVAVAGWSKMPAFDPHRLAAEALDKIGDKSVVPDLIEFLRERKYTSNNEGVRINAFGIVARVLTYLGDKAIVLPTLVEFLKDEKFRDTNYERYKTIAYALGLIADKPEFQDILDLLRKIDKNKDKKESAFSEFIRTYYTEINNLPAAKEENVEVLAYLLEGFDYLGDSSFQKEIEQRLIHIGKPAISAVAKRLSPSKYDSLTSTRAAYVLGEIGDKSAISYLIKTLLNHSDRLLFVEELANVLRKLGDKRFISALIEKIKDESCWPGGRIGAILALEHIGDESAIPDLLKLLEEERDSYRRELIERAINKIKDKSTTNSKPKDPAKPREGKTINDVAKRVKELEKQGFPRFIGVKGTESWIREVIRYLEQHNPQRLQLLQSLIKSGKLRAGPDTKNIFYGANNGKVALIATNQKNPAATLIYELNAFQGGTSEQNLKAEKEFLQEEEKLPEFQIVYTVKKGDTWGQIVVDSSKKDSILSKPLWGLKGKALERWIQVKGGEPNMANYKLMDNIRAGEKFVFTREGKARTIEKPAVTHPTAKVLSREPKEVKKESLTKPAELIGQPAPSREAVKKAEARKVPASREVIPREQPTEEAKQRLREAFAKEYRPELEKRFRDVAERVLGGKGIAYAGNMQQYLELLEGSKNYEEILKRINDLDKKYDAVFVVGSIDPKEELLKPIRMFPKKDSDEEAKRQAAKKKAEKDSAHKPNPLLDFIKNIHKLEV
ncbi:MAG: HEAT repeat domain-containing protein, partial [Candidatus Omnitrophica bacterium]|nr:HEAT repeat domain-containing protein [Candidatus Omnitrophota bacterium]